MRRRKNPESGMGVMLLEMLIVCAVLLILAAASAPSIIQLRAAQNQQDAKLRVQQVSQAQAAIAICAVTTGCVDTNLLPLVPAPGSITTQGYVFTFAAGWTFTAAPINMYSGHSGFYTDSTGLLHCASSGPVTAASPLCQ